MSVKYRSHSVFSRPVPGPWVWRVCGSFWCHLCPRLCPTWCVLLCCYSYYPNPLKCFKKETPFGGWAVHILCFKVVRGSLLAVRAVFTWLSNVRRAAKKAGSWKLEGEVVLGVFWGNVWKLEITPLKSSKDERHWDIWMGYWLKCWIILTDWAQERFLSYFHIKIRPVGQGVINPTYCLFPLPLGLPSIWDLLNLTCYIGIRSVNNNGIALGFTWTNWDKTTNMTLKICAVEFVIFHLDHFWPCKAMLVCPVRLVQTETSHQLLLDGLVQHFAQIRLRWSLIAPQWGLLLYFF